MPMRAEAIIPHEYRGGDVSFQRALDNVGRAMLRDYQSTVKTWRRRPEFELIVTEEQALVGTDNKVYGYVDEGTRPHLIQPKRAGGFLAFRPGSIAKTSPGVIGSKAGRPGRPPTVFSRGVRHPGTKARDFSKTIARRRQKTLEQTIRQEIAKQARQRGGG